MPDTIDKAIRRAGENIRDYFFPKNCFGCGEEGAWICESCCNGLFFINANFCPFCGNIDELFKVCGRCREVCGVRQAFSLFAYKDPLVQRLIKNFKYRYIKGVAEGLESIFRKFFIKYQGLFDLEDAMLVPVPLFWYKECERGFNQAEELAKILSKVLKISAERGIIKKIRSSRNQAEIKTEERLGNLEGAFRVISPPPKNVFIVDDVFTTGSTVKEIANVLRSAGAEKIQVITVAKG